MEQWFSVQMKSVYITWCCPVRSLRLRREQTDSACSRTVGWGEYLGLKGEDVTGSWRIMHNDELHELYLPNFVDEIKENEVVRVR